MAHKEVNDIQDMIQMDPFWTKSGRLIRVISSINLELIQAFWERLER